MAAARDHGAGRVGRIRLATRLPLIGEPMQGLAVAWRESYPDVELVVHELSERDIRIAIQERRVDLALLAKPLVWPRATSVSLYREHLLAGFPHDHALNEVPLLTWEILRNYQFLVQGWDESQAAREFYAAMMGSGVRFSVHPASKQSILGLVAAGFGITLVTQAQAEVDVPGVEYRQIEEQNASVEIQLVWLPENENAVVGRFVSFMGEQSASRRLL